MRVGYVRCSTAEQNEARQLKMMEEQKVEKIFIDKASGKNLDRKDFKAMIAFVRAGDTVIVESNLERQREGIEIIKAEGKYKGCKPIWILVSPPKTALRHMIILGLRISVVAER